ncbi:endonuclease [Streptomyces laurentii]|uniref:UPF0102 protein SLA_5504 n=1 Tax=Streptomyces laurentii TaxID=39478 RepID=A0A160P405_STRLU|nr:endonuclease [Streptomyces laurentii]
MNATQALGRYGEELAARTLIATGLHVLARNWRCGREGEIDIVARDGDTLVVCEVKTRREGPFEHPMAAVTPRKAERLRHLAACWLHRYGAPPGTPPGAPPDGRPSAGSVRIDLVGIVLPRRGAPVVTHARGIA